MARCVDHAQRQGTDVQPVSIPEQQVELTAIALKGRPLVKHLAKGLLHFRDVCTNADLAANLFLNIGCRGQVVGVNVGLEYERDFAPLLPHRSNHRIGRSRRGLPGGLIKIEH